MKKVLVSFLLIILTAILGQTAIAQDIMETLHDGSSFYYSPADSSWSRTSNSPDAIKFSKRGEKYYVSGKYAFSIKSDYDFISKKQFAAVNNSNLKFYTAEYKDGKFSKKEMTPNEVQSMFDEVKVFSTSALQKEPDKIKREPFSVKAYLIVNDTNFDYSDYVFSPKSLQRSPIKGMFTVRQAGPVKFIKQGDICLQKKYPYLLINVRTDMDKYKNMQTPAPRRVQEFYYRNY